MFKFLFLKPITTKMVCLLLALTCNRVYYTFHRKYKLCLQDMTDLSDGFKSMDSPDTLDSLLDFLKQSDSPVSGVMELRGLLLAQKEEKIELKSLLDQMRVDIQGIRQGILMILFE